MIYPLFELILIPPENEKLANDENMLSGTRKLMRNFLRIGVLSTKTLSLSLIEQKATQRLPSSDIFRLSAYPAKFYKTTLNP